MRSAAACGIRRAIALTVLRRAAGRARVHPTGSSRGASARSLAVLSRSYVSTLWLLSIAALASASQRFYRGLRLASLAICSVYRHMHLRDREEALRTVCRDTKVLDLSGNTDTRDGFTFPLKPCLTKSVRHYMWLTRTT
ncbi:hypothetical protein PSAB6_250234 [Paraburkholderia sabiae]|nr:hypothetical protein PSAB6_250234 [Paraburkholderia sabiae]